MELTANHAADTLSTRSRSSAADSFSFDNCTLKRSNPPSTQTKRPALAAPPVYRECLKNHAATLGGHALDGCCEFMPSPLSSASDPASLRCAACGCHRNFHRREDDVGAGNHSAGSDDTTNDDAAPKRRSCSSPPPPSCTPNPPPISASFFPSAPPVFLSLSSALAGGGPVPHQFAVPMARKRVRTKFTREQKDKMIIFSEKLGWKMQNQDEKVVEGFCNEIGVPKAVLKVWMHNNKQTFWKKDAVAESKGGGNDGTGHDDSTCAADEKSSCISLFHGLPSPS